MAEDTDVSHAAQSTARERPYLSWDPSVVSAQQLRELGDVGGDAPGLVAGQTDS
jgi:hypothetical protein